ncbi:MAG TPA: SDR family NAD(P)-dependent oxidoreductase, partial [Chitinophagales bacterium]|nr:SDR family NAD(P)-dependent oxidoreductase [Chitinophagales bacterium]
MTQPILTPMLPANSLADKTIIITGGGTGLGKAMAAMLLTLGAKIVITSRKEGVLQQAAADLRQLAQAEVLP